MEGWAGEKHTKHGGKRYKYFKGRKALGEHPIIFGW